MALKLSGFKKFMYKYVSGGMSIKIGKKKYLNYPKTANFMVPGITLSAFFQSNSMDIPSLFILGTVLIAVGFVSFFYPNFAPLTWEELDVPGKIWVVQSYGMGYLTSAQKREYLKIVDGLTAEEKKAYKIS